MYHSFKNWQFYGIFILFLRLRLINASSLVPIFETRVSRSISLARFRQIYGNLFAFITFTFAQCSRVFSSFVKSFHGLYFDFIFGIPLFFPPFHSPFCFPFSFFFFFPPLSIHAFTMLLQTYGKKEKCIWERETARKREREKWKHGGERTGGEQSQFVFIIFSLTRLTRIGEGKFSQL